MATGAQLGYDRSNYYVWPSPDGFAIHLGLQIVRELTAQVSSVGEIRGILVGRKISAPFAATIADDFVMVPAAQTFEEVQRALQKARAELHPIGFFRLQREGRLRLGAQDAQLFDRIFYEDGNIALLLRAPRRGTGEAALFYRYGGRAQPRDFGFGFPFDEAKLAGGHPGWRFPDPFESEEEPEPQTALSEGPESGGERIRWSRLLPTMILVVIAIVITQMVWSSRGNSPAASAAPAAETAAPTPLGLSVTSQPHELAIHWNRSAPAVIGAVKGTMRIADDGVTEEIPFEATELREGSVAYAPRTNDINIRFEVTAADGTVTAESLRAVAIP